MQMGLGFASMIDPTNGVSVAVISQFYVLLVTLLFLAFNRHLVLVDVLVEAANWQRTVLMDAERAKELLDQAIQLQEALSATSPESRRYQDRLAELRAQQSAL